jgi:Tfp pilus assembly protein PilF
VGFSFLMPESALDLLNAGHSDRAADLCRAAVQADPRDPGARAMLATALAALGRPVEAETEYRAALRYAPRDAAIGCAFGKFLLDRFRSKEAAAQAEAALVFAPDDLPAHNLLGMALAAQGRMDEAIEAFSRAVAADPSAGSSHANLGTALAVEGRFKEAFYALDQAIRLSPADIAIRVNQAITLLKAGRLPEGWAAWEWRHRQPRREKLPPALRLPRLDDPGQLVGRTVVIYHEEGFGDTLQFFRYVGLLADLGARIVLWLPDALTRLLRSQAANLDIITGDVTLPVFDYHSPINSLPLVFGTAIETIPGPPRYLAADPILTEHWARKLPSPTACRVGLCWAGEPRPYDPAAQALDRRRSVPLFKLEPLLATEGVTFVSLQKGAAARQVFAPVHDPMAEVEDFADTAAIIANLDLVISVDTAVAHLAGAMGKPIFLLDRYDNCWRWLTGRTDSPWYPTLRIFRQQRMGEWEPVIGDVAEALAAFVANKQDGA